MLWPMKISLTGEPVKEIIIQEDQITPQEGKEAKAEGVGREEDQDLEALDKKFSRKITFHITFKLFTTQKA
jgi:hypothetical protein